MSAPTAERPHLTSSQPKTGGEFPASRQFANTDIAQRGTQRLLLVQGTAGPSMSMEGWALKAQSSTDRDPKFLGNGIGSLVDLNLWHGTANRVRDAVKRHADDTGMKVDLLGLSDGGRRIAEAVIDPHGSFDPEAEVGTLLMVDAPIGDLRGFPQLDDQGQGIRTRAFYGHLDMLVNRLYLPRFKPTNAEVQENVPLPQLTHFDSLAIPWTQSRVLSHLNAPEPVGAPILASVSPLRTREMSA